MTVTDVRLARDYDRDKLDFDVADLDGNMIFFGTELKKS